MHAPLELLAHAAAAHNSSPAPPLPPPNALPLPPPQQILPSMQTLPTHSRIPVSTAPNSNLSSTPTVATPAPNLSAPIPHLSPRSPPSDVTASTGRSRPAAVGEPPLKKVRSRNAPRRAKRASDTPSVERASGGEKSSTAKSNGSARAEKNAEEDSLDNKRAMRAERNRQSAAASRERKKRHIKDLEDRVKYLTECHNALQYRFETEKKHWEERELHLQHENARLRSQLSRETAFRANPPPQNHPMTLHHLTHRGPVTY